ncbi:hypothetical protein B0H66DRAFT_574329 [Apodospora peruviana]|uniref:Uncharacterized protein n=1 Tax=Apodospora peruviana TaxID=516989 RepID=A0AAE0IB15_9PEZI|nr:hypothetical protein B0H66DRAFT_574329 [Apodospora peruviana]
MHMVSSSKLRLVDNRSAPTARPDPIDIVPARHLTESKGKPHDVFHIDCSPTSSFIATKHSNNHVKMWSIAKNAVHSTTKITSYFTPQARSREYFIRSHAILSESATLLAVTTHFGFNLEIHNFSKANSSSKKMQTIDDAHRWAASKRDAYQTNYAPLVVYRPKPNRIDKFFLARHPNAKKPFWEDPSSAIELERCGLPFVPKFPELAYSANSPFLIAAAGPRHELNPGGMSSNNNSGNNVILVAWQMTPVSENRLQARSPADTMSIHSNDSSSTYGDSRHAPYRYIVPDYPALQNALPAVLAAHGSLSVSIWIPATHQDIPLPGNKFRRTPVSAPERFVLVWDLPSNSTRIFGIPNVQSCVSPDCRFVAYCDTARSAFVIVDVGSAEEVWRWPPDPGGASPTSSGWASFNGQLENLSKVTVFEFSADSKMLVVGDTSGSLGVYQVKDEAPGHGPGGRYELPPTGPSPTLPQQPWHKGINELQ